MAKATSQPLKLLQLSGSSSLNTVWHNMGMKYGVEKEGLCSLCKYLIEVQIMGSQEIEVQAVAFVLELLVQDEEGEKKN